jgi:putative FmdB family regulatory protein
MPILDFRCPEHGDFEVFRHPSAIKDTEPCEECGAESKRVYSFRRPHSYSGMTETLVLHQDADGHYLVPAHRDAPVPEGCTKVEFRSVQEVRRVERQMTEYERAKFSASIEREEMAFEAEAAENRGELLRRMPSMSNRGRDLARLAIERSNNRQRRQFRGEIHFEAFSMNSSNREPWRDENSGWKGVRK